MKRITIILSFIISSSVAFSQGGRMVLNNNVFVVIDGGAKLVVSNPSTNAVSTIGTGGNIISESELDELIWNIASSTGVYTVPFTSKPISQGGTGVKIPLSLNLTAAGSGDGKIQFSTYETTNDFNSPYPTGVTSMNTTTNIDASLYSVDRYWMMDNSTYTSKPTANISFTYVDLASEIGGSNLISEPDLIAQRWNSTSGSWETLTYGTVNATNNTVSNVNVDAANFFEVWTLQSILMPLDIELTKFTVIDENCHFEMQWSISESLGNTTFYVYKSLDGYHWDLQQTIESKESPNGDYQFIDDSRNVGSCYYKLVGKDVDGIIEELKTVSYNGSCDSEIMIYPNPTMGDLTIEGENLVEVKIVDNFGRILESTQLSNYSNKLNLSNLKKGCYTLILIDDMGNSYNRKIIKE